MKPLVALLTVGLSLAMARAEEPSQPTIFVAPLEADLTQIQGWQPALGEGLAEMLTTELGKTHKFQVLESTALESLKNEIKLGDEGFVSGDSKVEKGESIRVFPLSNWTEMDVWAYIELENIPIVPLYYAKEREMVVRGNQLIPLEHNMPLAPGEKPQMVMSRMRSLGCTYCTGAIASDADTMPKIINELVQFRRSERENRIIDHDQEGSMELKKREGYF